MWTKWFVYVCLASSLNEVAPIRIGLFNGNYKGSGRLPMSRGRKNFAPVWINYSPVYTRSVLSSPHLRNHMSDSRTISRFIRNPDSHPFYAVLLRKLLLKELLKRRDQSSQSNNHVNTYSLRPSVCEKRIPNLQSRKNIYDNIEYASRNNLKRGSSKDLYGQPSYLVFKKRLVNQRSGINDMEGLMHDRNTPLLKQKEHRDIKHLLNQHGSDNVRIEKNHRSELFDNSGDNPSEVLKTLIQKYLIKSKDMSEQPSDTMRSFASPVYERRLKNVDFQRSNEFGSNGRGYQAQKNHGNSDFYRYLNYLKNGYNSDPVHGKRMRQNSQLSDVGQNIGLFEKQHRNNCVNSVCNKCLPCQHSQRSNGDHDQRSNILRNLLQKYNSRDLFGQTSDLRMNYIKPDYDSRSPKHNTQWFYDKDYVNNFVKKDTNPRNILQKYNRGFKRQLSDLNMNPAFDSGSPKQDTQWFYDRDYVNNFGNVPKKYTKRIQQRNEISDQNSETSNILSSVFGKNRSFGRRSSRVSDSSHIETRPRSHPVVNILSFVVRILRNILSKRHAENNAMSGSNKAYYVEPFQHRNFRPSIVNRQRSTNLSKVHSPFGRGLSNINNAAHSMLHTIGGVPRYYNDKHGSRFQQNSNPFNKFTNHNTYHKNFNL